MEEAAAWSLFALFLDERGFVFSVGSNFGEKNILPENEKRPVVRIIRYYIGYFVVVYHTCCTTISYPPCKTVFRALFRAKMAVEIQ